MQCSVNKWPVFKYVFIFCLSETFHLLVGKIIINFEKEKEMMMGLRFVKNIQQKYGINFYNINAPKFCTKEYSLRHLSTTSKLENVSRIMLMYKPENFYCWIKKYTFLINNILNLNFDFAGYQQSTTQTIL